jgi:hypothetical protein
MPLAEQEFVRMLNLIDNEVETAFITFQSYEELNRLALEDEHCDRSPGPVCSTISSGSPVGIRTCYPLVNSV